MCRNKQVQIFILLAIFVPTPIKSGQEWIYKRFADVSSARTAKDRFLTMMQQTYRDTVQREQDFGYIRYTYEQSSQYEQGYVFGEIIERYKKMTDQFKRMHEFKNKYMYDHLDSIEMMQKLYFEIYHLVAMMHEIPKKYAGEEEPQHNLTEEEKLQLSLAQQAFFEAQEQQKIETQKALAKHLKKKEQESLGLKKPPPENPVGGNSGLTKNIDFDEKDAKNVGQGRGPSAYPRNKKFPLDYGWEIDNWN